MIDHVVLDISGTQIQLSAIIAGDVLADVVERPDIMDVADVAEAADAGVGRGLVGRQRRAAGAGGGQGVRPALALGSKRAAVSVGKMATKDHE